MIEKENRRLNSWKEIADYLDRDVSTVARWEKSKGLPVQRIPGGKRQAVFAYTEAIDQWLASANAQDLNGNGHAAPARQRFRSALRVAVFGIVAFLIPTFLVLIGADHWIGSKKPLLPIATVSLHGGDLVVRSKTGEPVWTYSFRERLGEPKDVSRSSYVGDLDGDGSQEVLLFAHLAEAVPGAAGSGHKLYCFSADGKRLWDFDFSETLAFGGRDYRPPWLLRAFHVYESRGEKRIAFAMSHAVWWPTALLVLDGHGRLCGKFLNPGWIVTLAFLPTASRNFLLAGGYDNSRKAGMMAVLDVDHVSGASVQEPRSAYECNNCPPGKPVRYFVFPRSELNTFATVSPDRPHHVGAIQVTEGTIEVRAMELLSENVETIFEFSSDFELRSASFSDSHEAVHRRLEQEKKINHSFENCPERSGPGLVRAWDPAKGWLELSASDLN